MKMQYPLGGVPAERDTAMPKKTLAMAYIVDQVWRDLYDTEQGFSVGTLFRELHFPYTGRKAGGGNV